MISADERANWSVEEIVLRRIDANRLSRNSVLDLSVEDPRHGLSSLPTSLWDLTHLTALNLSGHRLQFLPRGLRRLTKLIELNVSGNELTDVADTKPLSNGLASLNLSDNRLSQLPSLLQVTPHLVKLDVGSNPLRDIPTWISGLRHLGVLGLGGLNLEEVPEWVRRLSNLRSLSLNSNPLTRFGPINSLSLTSLGLWLCRLQEVPDSLRQLHELRELNLGGNFIRQVPPWVGELRELQVLNLGGNQIRDLPSTLAQLEQLQVLNLGNNQLAEVPDVVFRLHRLETLDLANASGYSAPDATRRMFDRTNENSIHHLSDRILQLRYLRQLSLRGNPIESPPLELVGLDWYLEGPRLERIWSYLRQLSKEGTARLLEAKVLLVGESGSGKTTLAWKLLDPDAPMPSEDDTTRGIEVNIFHFDADGQPFRVNVWDFGGQEIYHETHQFFLTKRSLYLLLADDRKEDSDFYYWMHVIEALSHASPVIIVHNEKSDRRRDIDEKVLRGRFSNLVDSFRTNLKTTRGLADLVAEVEHQVRRLPHVGTPLPATWVRVRDALERDPRDYISVDEYYDICEASNFFGRKEQIELADYLHDLGVFLHFQDDPLLARLVILKPQWGTDAVYRILDDPEIRDRNGEFTYADVKRLWPDARYFDKHAELLSLMERFGLCFRLTDTSPVYVTPQLLAESASGLTEPDTEHIVVMYKYRFMPKGIVLRLIASLHQFVDQERVWRRGFELTYNDSRGRVTENWIEQSIKISAWGGAPRDLMSGLLFEIDRINESFKNVSVEKLYPCSCGSCRVDPDPYFFTTTVLTSAVDKKVPGVQCQKSFEMVDVVRLVDGIASRAALKGAELVQSAPNPLEGDLVRATARAVFIGPVGSVHMEPTTAEHDRLVVPQERSLRSNGMFVLGAILVITGAFTVAAGVLNPWIAVTVLGLVIVALVVWGVITLRSTDQLSESGSLAWLQAALSKLPVLGGRRKRQD